MRDATPTGDGASRKAARKPDPGSAVLLAGSSTASDQAPSAEGAKAFSLSSDAPAGANGSASMPHSAEGAAPASGAPLQRTLLDLKKALQSAVRVLTKERSFSLGHPPMARAQSELAAGALQAAAGDASAEPRPAGLSGHTSTVAIPEVLGFLAQLRKSGTLWIWNEHEQFRVQLVDGNVTFARNETPHQGALLGEVLVSQGAIEARRLEEFLKQPRENGPLGDALIKAGLLDRKALSDAVHSQAQRVFHRAYGLEDACFCFDANRGEDAQRQIQISVTQMLFESARERDESEQRQSKPLDAPSKAK